jgi:hypothetical protein
MKAYPDFNRDRCFDQDYIVAMVENTVAKGGAL